MNRRIHRLVAVAWAGCTSTAVGGQGAAFSAAHCRPMYGGTTKKRGSEYRIPALTVVTLSGNQKSLLQIDPNKGILYVLYAFHRTHANVGRDPTRAHCARLINPPSEDA